MLFSRKKLIRIIVPLLIEQFVAVTIGMADSVMVASAGEAAVSGVSLVDTVNLFLVFVFTALGTGGAVVCSQYVGKKDYQAARGAAKQLIYSATFVAICVMTLTLLFHGVLLNLIFGKIDADVMSNAKIYFLITALGHPFMALSGAGGAIFRATGNSKTPMLLSLSACLVNVIGNAVFIFGFGLGAAGAALGTLVARVFGAVATVILVCDRRRPLYVDRLLHYKPDFREIKRILHIGVPNGMENGMFQFGKILTQSLVSSMGTAVIAANAVAGTISSFQYAIGGAFSMTMLTVVGTCIGAGEKEQAKKYTKRLLVAEYVIIFALTLVIVLGSNFIVGVYELSETSASIATSLILLHGVGIITIWPLGFSLPNAFRAASDVRYTLIVSTISMWTLRVALSYVLGAWLNLGIMGVWIAMLTDWVFRAAFFLVRFLRGRWLLKYDLLEKKRELQEAGR